MEKQVMIVSLIVGFLGLLSVILGFTAEVTKINASDVFVSDYACIYPSSPAFGSAIVAALLLLVAQIIASAFSGCCGCCKKATTGAGPTGTKRTLAIIFAVISWITFAVSIALFVLGAARNGTGGQTTYDTCHVIKPGVFATAAIFSLITVCLSVAAYILLQPSTGASAKLAGAQFAQGGIAMGQPQFPQPGSNYTNGPQQQYPPPGTGSHYPPPGTAAC